MYSRTLFQWSVISYNFIWIEKAQTLSIFNISNNENVDDVETTASNFVVVRTWTTLKWNKMVVIVSKERASAQ